MEKKNDELSAAIATIEKKAYELGVAEGMLEELARKRAKQSPKGSRSVSPNR